MESVRFKTGLFGFRRKQVLDYVDATCAAYEAKIQQVQQQGQEALTALQTEYDGKIRAVETSLQLQQEENSRLNDEVTHLGESLREKFDALEAEKNRAAQLAQDLEEARQTKAELSAQVTSLGAKVGAASLQQKGYLHKILEQQQLIEKQEGEVARLHGLVAMMEERMSAFQSSVEQDTAMVNCLNVLHERNRNLTAKVAMLESQLETKGTEKEVQKMEESANQKQEVLKSAEALFNSVRKEIQEALQSIAQRIESAEETPSETVDNFFVDLAEL